MISCVALALVVAAATQSPAAQPPPASDEIRVSVDELGQLTLRGFVRDVLPGIADGRIVPVIDRVFPLDRIADAKAHMESNAQVGKIVVRVA